MRAPCLRCAIATCDCAAPAHHGWRRAPSPARAERPGASGTCGRKIAPCGVAREALWTPTPSSLPSPHQVAPQARIADLPRWGSPGRLYRTRLARRPKSYGPEAARAAESPNPRGHAVVVTGRRVISQFGPPLRSCAVQGHGLSGPTLLSPVTSLIDRAVSSLAIACLQSESGQFPIEGRDGIVILA